MCECGCGKRVAKEGNKYLLGHSGGGLWQYKYDKNSDEYKNIVKKIKRTTSESMRGIKKTKEHCDNISKGRKNWILKNRSYFNEIMDKMKETKQKQLKDGILSIQHYANNRSEKEIDDIYNRIVKSSNKTKNAKKELGIYPDIWNKGKSKFNDSSVAKYSGENHYLWNPDKTREYDDKFYDFEYRSYLLERQGSKCLLCDNDKRILCLHHMDKNKKNSNENNLVFVCRSCHSKIHNDYTIMTKKIKELKNGIFRSFLDLGRGDRDVVPDGNIGVINRVKTVKAEMPIPC